MSIIDLKFVQDFIRLGMDGVHKGWHERNGGNLTYRMKEEDIVSAMPFFSFDRKWSLLEHSCQD